MKKDQEQTIRDQGADLEQLFNNKRTSGQQSAFVEVRTGNGQTTLALNREKTQTKYEVVTGGKPVEY